MTNDIPDTNLHGLNLGGRDPALTQAFVGNATAAHIPTSASHLERDAEATAWRARQQQQFQRQQPQQQQQQAHRVEQSSTDAAALAKLQDQVHLLVARLQAQDAELEQLRAVGRNSQM